MSSPCPGTVDLQPETSSGLVDRDHTLTATVADGGANPCPGINVLFQVDSPNGIPQPPEASGTTDGGGAATFTFRNKWPGVDTITACTNGDGTLPTSCDDAGVISDTATKEWTTTCPFVIRLDPEVDENPVNSPHTVTATVENSHAKRCRGVIVRFEVQSQGNPVPNGGTDRTTEEGEATFTYTNGTAGTDTIVACVREDGKEPGACDSTEIRDTATKVWTGGVEPVLTCRSSAIRIEDPDGNVLLEPFVANESGGACTTEDASLVNQTFGGGPTDPGGLTIKVLSAETDEGGTAQAGVLQVIITDGTGIEILAVRILVSEASAQCVNGTPTLSSASRVLSLTLPDGTVVTVPPDDPATPEDESDIDITQLDPLLRLFLNDEQVSEGGEKVTRQALRVETPLGTLVLAESIADVHDCA